MNQEIVRAERADGRKTRDVILSAAASLATTEGLDGLSIGRLAEHIGMSKSGLYAHFGSKEELQLATIETALATFHDFVIKPTLAIENPVKRIEALGERFLEHLRVRVFPGGCFFASAAAELDTHPGPVRARIVEVQNQWDAGIIDLISQAKALSLIGSHEDPEQLAFELNAYLLMANMAFVLSDNPEQLDPADAAFRARIDRARPP